MTACLRPVTNFFTNPQNQSARFFRSQEGQDKTLKLIANGVLPTVILIADRAGASSGTMEGLGTAHSLTKAARDVNGFFNVFRGAIPGIYTAGKQVGDVCGGLITANIVDLRTDPDVRALHPNPGYNERAETRGEKLTNLGVAICNFVSSSTYVAAFGAARPTAHAKKYFGADIGETGQRVAGTFGHLMCANHAASVAKNSLDMAYQFQAYNREARRGVAAAHAAENTFYKRVTTCVLGLIEQLLLLLQDVLTFLRFTDPAVQVSLNLTISVLGFSRVWYKYS